MRVNVVCALLLLGLTTGPAAVAADEPPRPEVVGLSIVKPDPQDQFGGSVVHFCRAGVEVHLRLAVPDEFLLKVAIDEERPFSVTDNQGTLLTTDRDNDLIIGPGAEFAEDRRSFQWSVEATKLPSTGATHLHLQGNLLLTCGLDRRAVTGTVAAEAGQQFQIGQVPVTITKVGKLSTMSLFGPLEKAFSMGQDDDFKWGIRFETKHPGGFTPVRNLKFFTSDGQPVKSRWSASGGGSANFGVATPLPEADDDDDHCLYYVEYKIAAPLSSFQYRADCFQQLKTVTVPIDVKVGLGL